MTPTPLAMSAAPPSASPEEAQDEPPTARSPAIYADVIEDEKTIAIPPATIAAAEAANAEETTSAVTSNDSSGAETSAAETSAATANAGDEARDDEIPISATPSMEALISRIRPEESARGEAPKSRSFLDRPEYDLRPPDIQVEPSDRGDRMTPPIASRTVRTDAPVAGTYRPPSAPRTSNRSGLVAGALLLAAGAVFFGARAMQRDEEPPVPAAPPTLEEATRQLPEDETKAKVLTPEPAPPVTPPGMTATSTDTAITSPQPARTEPAPPSAPKTREAKGPSSLDRAPKKLDSAVIPASLIAEPSDADREKVQPTAPTPNTPFDAGAASTALDTAASQASTCRKVGDPSGSATVTITFSPSGRVTTANVSGPPFAGTETGSCIAARLRGARVPAFSGDFITVKKTVAIQ